MLLDDERASIDFHVRRKDKGHTGRSIDQEGRMMNVITADHHLLARLDEIAAQSKQTILTSPNPAGFRGTVYYVSPFGDDANHGKSEAKPIQSLEQANRLPVLPGDAVLFRRGGTWRGHLFAAPGVTYSAYGAGPKPVLNASAKNYAGRFTPVSGEKTLYACDDRFEKDVGIMVFDSTGEIGKYDEIVGIKRLTEESIRFPSRPVFRGLCDLKRDLEFYHDPQAQTLYLCSTKGAPEHRFASIEIGDRENAVSIGGNGVTIDNLAIRFTGAHGVGTGNVKDLTVTNNIFCYLGGSILAGFDGGNATRYGNAVEIYGSVEGFHVENNWIYQIYDTSITHQFSPTTSRCVHKEILYRKNLIEYCNWSIEFYNREPTDGSERIVSNVLCEENICRFSGYGWGAQRPDKSGAHCNSFGLTNRVENFRFDRNIFDRADHYLIRLNRQGGDRNIVFTQNTFVQDADGLLGLVYGEQVPFANGKAAQQAAFDDGSNVFVTIPAPVGPCQI